MRGRRSPRTAGEKGLGYSEADTTIRGSGSRRPFAPVGEIALDGFALCLRGSSPVSSVRFDGGEIRPSNPWLGRMAERFLAFYRATNFVPPFFETAELL